MSLVGLANGFLTQTVGWFDHWPYWLQLLAVAAYLHFEWWLGKTEKIQSNSTLQLIGSVLHMTIGKIPMVEKVTGLMAGKAAPPKSDPLKEVPPPSETPPAP